MTEKETLIHYADLLEKNGIVCPRDKENVPFHFDGMQTKNFLKLLELLK